MTIRGNLCRIPSKITVLNPIQLTGVLKEIAERAARPPGTGKTWNTVYHALAIIEGNLWARSKVKTAKTS